jgi:DNA polymerase-3 subunit delta
VKLSSTDAQAFLRNPPSTVRLALIYGPDIGLVGERAAQLTHSVAGADANDPFRVVQLEGSVLAKDPARLADEAAQLSLLGGRRIVRLRDVPESVAKSLAALLAGSTAEALIIVEGGDLGRASPLRKLAEAERAAVAIACYEDGPRELIQLLRDAAREHRIQLADDALQYLTAHLGADRQLSRQEVEKLVLYAGDGGRLNLADVAALVGDSSALDLDEVVYSAFDLDREATNNGLDRLFRAGEQPVSVVRAAQRHAQRLHLAAGRVATGETLDRTVQAQHLFFKFAPRFRAQLERWKLPQLAKVLKALTEAELDCKTTGYPDETLCRAALLMLGRTSRA